MKNVWIVGFRDMWGDVQYELSEYHTKRGAERRRLFLQNLEIKNVFIKRRYR